jgi:hypothetical protein
VIIEKFRVQASCASCGGTGAALKLSSPLSVNFLPFFRDAGFTEQPSFTKAGMFYVENQELIATGSFNTKILQLKCKYKDCSDSISIVEGLLSKMA